MAVRINAPLLGVTVLLFVTCGMMAFAIAKPAWSSSTWMQAGLWSMCTWNGNWLFFSYYTCVAVGGSIPTSTTLVACRALAVGGTLLASLTACLACLGTCNPNSFLGCTLSCLCLFCGLFFTAAWGTWIGVHDPNLQPMGWVLGYCFILCVVASVLMFLGAVLSLWGVRSHTKQKQFLQQQMAAEIEFPDLGHPDLEALAHHSTPVPGAAHHHHDRQKTTATVPDFKGP